MNSKIERSLRLGTVALLVAVGAGPGGAAASTQTPVQTDCPTGYERLAVSSFASPYILPAIFDDEGNANGFVCALALPDGVRDAFCRSYPGTPVCDLQELGLPVYRFLDDDARRGGE